MTTPTPDELTNAMKEKMDSLSMMEDGSGGITVAEWIAETMSIQMMQATIAIVDAVNESHNAKSLKDITDAGDVLMSAIGRIYMSGLLYGVVTTEHGWNPLKQLDRETIEEYTKKLSDTQVSLMGDRKVGGGFIRHKEEEKPKSLLDDQLAGILGL